MKKLFFFLFTLLVQLAVFAQPGFKTIKVSADIELIKISENAYVHISYFDMPEYGRVPANGLIFTVGNEAFLFDSPWTDSLTQELFTWMTDSMKINIAGFIPSHWHIDCMGGLDFLKKQKIISYANQMTVENAKSRNLPVPDHGFEDSLHLQLGNKWINCYYMGAGHSMDNIVVWIPSEQILFAGCLVKSLNSNNLGNTIDGDLAAYPETINKLIDKFPTAKIVVPGHGQFGGLELIKHTRDLATK